MKATSGKTPGLLSSSTTKEPESRLQIEIAMASIESSSRSDQQRLRDMCLRREGYKCALTGKADRDSVQRRLVERTGQERVMQCAHILPFGLSVFDEKDSRQVSTKLIVYYKV